MTHCPTCGRRTVPIQSARADRRGHWPKGTPRHRHTDLDVAPWTSLDAFYAEFWAFINELRGRKSTLARLLCVSGSTIRRWEKRECLPSDHDLKCLKRLFLRWKAQSEVLTGENP